MPVIMTHEEAEYAFEFQAHEIARIAFHAGKIGAAEYMVSRNARDLAGAAWDTARGAQVALGRYGE